MIQRPYRLFLLGAILIGAIVVTPASGRINAGPPISIDVQPVEAVDSTGADVTYSVNASDPDLGTPLATTCDHPAGGGGTGVFELTDHFPIGDTTVTCSATTGAGDAVSTPFTVTVKDTTAPTVTVSANIGASTSNPAGRAVSYDAPSANDSVDGTVTATCDHPDGSNFPIGPTLVTCSATDAHSNTGQASFTVTVTLIDITLPTLTVPADFSVSTDTAGGKAVSYTATAADDLDGAITPVCVPASGATFPVGPTGVHCSATDAHGNGSTADFTVTVTLVDITPPLLTVPDSFSLDAPDPSGAIGNYVASASDNIDGAITPVCAPASGTTFPLGATTVTCTATDAHSNQTQKTFTITVAFNDVTAPVVAAVADIRREANGPGGSIVSYPTPTAVDAFDGPIPTVTCAPPSGSLFSLGSTTVTCSASDSHGNVGTRSFHVVVVDETPPRLSLPSDIAIYATDDAGIAATEPVIAAFLATVRATDIVDLAPRIANDSPARYPIGTTTVTFTARDAAGNATSGQSAVIVYPKTPGSPPLPPPPVVDRTPPPDVGSLTAKPGNGTVVLKWSDPSEVDFDHVLIMRSDTSGGASPIAVFTGRGPSYVDRGLTNGVEYRYVVASADQAGNQSAGVAVVATPKRNFLISPVEGARLTAPPRLTWIRTHGADYYNVQLFRGTTKILSVWPLSNQLTLHRSWTYSGRSFTLSPALYRWYVWPGFGPRAAVRYGGMLGARTFQITR